jgi:DoxX-like family
MQANRLCNCSYLEGGLWTGRVMSTLAALFLFMDGVMKLMKPEMVVKATVELGYPESVILELGIVLLICVILYAIPVTSVLGAILLTGYLGGAVATHVPRRRSTLHPHFVPSLRRSLDLGRTLLARPTVARTHPSAIEMITQPDYR